MILQDDDNKNNNILDMEKMDNKILMGSSPIFKTRKKVFFVSKDVNARIKAEALGIPSQDYKYQKS